MYCSIELISHHIKGFAVTKTRSVADSATDRVYVYDRVIRDWGRKFLESKRNHLELID